VAEQETSLRLRRTELLLYCVGGACSAVPAGLRGVHGAQIQRIAQGELVALVSPVVELARVETPEAVELVAYERIIRSQHAVADVVPMRFGSVLPDEAAVRTHLDEQRAAYLRSLARISGCVEMGVRALISVTHPSAAPELAVHPPARSGVDYLKTRQRRYSTESQLRDDCAALEQSLLSKVAPLCREHRVELAPLRSGVPTLCSVYFLVPREQVPAFRAALSPVTDGDCARATLSGPWPPFNFVD
jgi:Gas vesicle synthesis protein GvpL/GvpF